MIKNHQHKINVSKTFPFFATLCLWGGCSIGVCEVGFAQQLSRIEEVTLAIHKMKEDTGVSPNDLDVLDMLIRTNTELSSDELGTLFQVIENIQAPIISKENLRRLLLSKKDVIRSLEQKYEHRAVEYGADASIVHREQKVITSVLKGGKLYIAREDGKSAGKFDSLSAFDGEVEREVYDLQTDAPHASIYRLRGRETYFDLGNILRFSMLLDGTSDLQSGVAVGYDIIQLLDHGCCIFEKKEKYQDAECLIVSNGIFRVFLDIDKDFSVVHVDSYDIHLVPVASGLVIPKIVKDAESSGFEFVDFGNGIWFPMKTKLTFGDGARIIGEAECDFEYIRLNSEIEDSLFTDIIPEDVIVSDSINGLTYIYGDRASINGMLKSVVKSKRQWFWQYISMTTGIILIIIWIIIKYVKYRAYLKAKNAE
jgi:hypothetical protein